MKDVLTHLNTIVPLITLIMCYLLQVLTYASFFLTTLKFDHSNNTNSCTAADINKQRAFASFSKTRFLT